MNAKKASPEGRTKKRTFPWLRRGLLAALIAAAAVLAPLIQIGLGALVRRFHRTETPANGVTVG